MTYDAIIIGGGPAGTTSATLLAKKGHRVLLVEKTTFPRYHVGESLMPFCWFTLDRLGVIDRMQEIGFTRKHSVQFATTDGKISAPFYFFQHFDHPAATTWQVERKDFDLMLLDNARSHGVAGALSRGATRMCRSGHRSRARPMSQSRQTWCISGDGTIASWASTSGPCPSHSATYASQSRTATWRGNPS